MSRRRPIGRTGNSIASPISRDLHEAHHIGVAGAMCCREGQPVTSQTTDRLGEPTPGFMAAAEITVSHRQMRCMTGVRVEIAHLHGPCQHPEYLRSKRPRLTAILEQVGGPVEMLLTPHCPAPSMPTSAEETVRHLTFVPAGIPLWQVTRRSHYIRRLIIDFDLAELAERFGETFEFTSRLAPRVMFQDDRLLALVELLADACVGTDPDDRFYGDSLALAISHNLFGLRRQEERRGGLAPAQLRRVTVLMEQSLPKAVFLKDLADVIGLSEAYFARAFKASTGVSPHRWYLAAKIRKAQNALLETSDTLAEVALATGFADQSHFTRAFRTITGLSPGAWRRTIRQRDPDVPSLNYADGLPDRRIA
ncbi:MAG: helix-turn-helix domain-containing protein [Mesorhizobium sp.]|nr:MAG: AraC family transcriptional regulator [Mesorhizobium sp.]RWL25702.1 MAG: AraC family transcriptional regulator [Mesorhizobium sp.]RWL36549.1 MAG: AraC family transcriptional regulator [Mesorhizobium sp.]RWL40691.1 MAG: AraC family transcriptional regulator [Mesorhizobium sp.]RWL58700.1 MAG: AraC family transcriptional regulator [Mesorhizobium sp.]